MKPVVFVQTNARRRLTALIAAFSFRRHARRPDGFSVRLIDTSDFPELEGRDARPRGGRPARRDPGDLRSFAPLRFAVPDLLQHSGIALVVEPDVFAVGDVGELFARDRAGKAIWCHVGAGHGAGTEHLASSVMLLDCERLSHWRFANDLRALRSGEMEYADWIALRLEEPDTIGLLEREWNDLDRLAAATRLLHVTRRRAFAWETRPARIEPRASLLGRVAEPLHALSASRFRSRADRLRAFTCGLLADAVDTGAIGADEIDREVAARHVRPDWRGLVERYRGSLWPAGPRPAGWLDRPAPPSGQERSSVRRR